MKITNKLTIIDTTNKMTIAFDVSKKKLNYYSEIRGKLSGTSCKETKICEDEIQNSTNAITSTLKYLTQFSYENGYDGIHVICEPTGVYSDALMRTARRIGCSTAYISGESVFKAKVIENNDSSKDDIKDPRTIYMLSKMGKEQCYRHLPAEYQALREYNRIYDECSSALSKHKALMQTLIYRIFCDFPMSKDFVFDKSGRALMKLFEFSPYRIAATTFKTFSKQMQKEQPRIRQKTLEKLYQHATYSVHHCIAEDALDALTQRIKYTWADCEAMRSRKDSIRQEITAIYHKLKSKGDLMPIEDEKVFKPFVIGRLLGESGPLKDFPNKQALLKYAGLNLRRRESGTVKGKLKISKKGRVPFRGVLGTIVFGFTRKTQVFGDYYHKRKATSPGTRIMAILERKLLKMFFSLSKNEEQFNKSRFVACESQYAIAA